MQTVPEAAAQLAAFLDGYGADDDLRAALPATMTQRVKAMYALLQQAHETGREPWATMYIDGHGHHWLATAKFIVRISATDSRQSPAAQRWDAADSETRPCR